MMVALVIHTLVKHMRASQTFFFSSPNLGRIIPFNLHPSRQCLCLCDARGWEAVDVTLMSMCLLCPGAGVDFLFYVVIHSFPNQEASHYSLESHFLIAGQGCRHPDAGVMGSRVIIIKNTEPTLPRLYGLQTAAFKAPPPQKNPIPSSYPFWKPSFLHTVNPSS